MEQIERTISANKFRYLTYNNRNDDYVRSMVIKAQKAGYGISEGNVTPGAVGTGLPIKNAKGWPIAAISVTAVSWRMTKNHIKEIVELVKSEISAINLDFKDN